MEKIELEEKARMILSIINHIGSDIITTKELEKRFAAEKIPYPDKLVNDLKKTAYVIDAGFGFRFNQTNAPSVDYFMNLFIKYREYVKERAEFRKSNYKKSGSFTRQKSNNDDIDKAIKLLKANGYKIMKPEVKFIEV